jgi:hypothetical protein
MNRILGIFVVPALALGACSSAGPTAGPGGTPTPSPTITVPPSPATPKPVSIYYLVGGESGVFVTFERHSVAATTPQAALEDLVHGTPHDPDHFSPYPKAARILSVSVTGGIATVDWSAEVLQASVGAETEARGIQAAVYTLTEFSTITRVRFTVEGKASGTSSNGRRIEDWWGHVGLGDQPFARSEEPDVLAPIVLLTPLDGARSSGTLELTGEASTFEANVGIVLRDATGKEVLRTSATAAEAAPARGGFSKTITFTPPSTPQTWTLEAFEASAKDGSITFAEARSIKAG